ncbi:MAG: class I SAM-dependent methyltransferase [Candidatus Heimdallarchaeaceae archaeon]
MNLKELSQSLVRQYGVQTWFDLTPRERKYSKDLLEWIDKMIPREARILETGCGIGQILAELWFMGYYDLTGVEVDYATVACGIEFLSYFGVKAKIYQKDARFVNDLFNEELYDLILPLNWTYREEVDLKKILLQHSTLLVDGGWLVIDVIDSTYDNPYHTSDMMKPERDRRLTEYPNRYSVQNIQSMAELLSLEVQLVRKDYFPRYVYYMKKRERRV